MAILRRKNGTYQARVIGWDFILCRKSSATSEYLAVSPTGELLSYEFYLETLKRYCKDLGLPNIGTHGLRHSASEMYLEYGASEDDIKLLFAHSSPEITERYFHGRGRNLANVAIGMRLFESKSTTAAKIIWRSRIRGVTNS